MNRLNQHFFSTALGIALLSFTAFAQETIDVTKDLVPGLTKPVPVNLSGFSGEALEVASLRRTRRNIF